MVSSMQFSPLFSSAHTRPPLAESSIRSAGSDVASYAKTTLVEGAKKAEFTPLTAEQASGTILGFIARQLERDKAAGASTEELQARLEAGLEGFNKGFNEAREKIEALSLLSPELDAQIGKTYDLVTRGIDNLALDYLGRSLDASAAAEAAAPSVETPKARPQDLFRAEYQAARADTFSFELTTAEGDKVSIKAARFDAVSASVSAGGGRYAAEASSLQASQFSLSIEGDLNDDERAAIYDLMQQIDSLAADFYAGDLDSAFNAALDLGYDTEEISAFALNLTRVEVQRASAAYTDDKGAGETLQSRLEPLGHFVRNLLEALDKAEQFFAEPRELLANLSGAVLDPNAGDKPQAFTELVGRMLASLNPQLSESGSAESESTESGEQ